MTKGVSLITNLLIGLTIFTMACQTFTNLTASRTPVPTPVSWPQSAFVWPERTVQLMVGQPLTLETYYASPENLSNIRVFLNGQPVEVTESAIRTQPSSVPLADVALYEAGKDAARISSMDSLLSAKTLTVDLVFVGYTPGTYELKVISVDVVDNEERESAPIVKQIEVIDPEARGY